MRDHVWQRVYAAQRAETVRLSVQCVHARFASWLRIGQNRAVLVLGGLFGDAEHGTDLGPGSALAVSLPHRLEDCCVDLLAQCTGRGSVADIEGVAQGPVEFYLFRLV